MKIIAQKQFMNEAIREAQIAYQNGDYAVGAVIVQDDKIIATASNRSKRDESPTAHAELLAIEKACEVLGRRHISDCVIYVTHEPCPMCASVIVWARLAGVVYGARIDDMVQYRKQKANNDYLWRSIDIPCHDIFSHSTEIIKVVKDFMREECVKLFHSELFGVKK